MALPILMPQFGQMTEACTIVEWYKKEGDRIAKGDILFTIETDKSAMDVESFEEGTLLKIVVPAGTSAPVQSTVGFLGKPGEQIPDAAPSMVAGKSFAESGPSTAMPNQPAPGAAAAVPANATVPPEAAPAVSPATAVPAPRPKVSPRAAALARDLGVDVAQISGSGPGGRVVEADVRAYASAGGLKGPQNSPGPPGAETPPDIEPMSRMRRVIAQRLAQSFRDTPHIYLTVSIDMTDLVAFRAELKATGAPYTITDFVSQAVVLALREVPQLNNSTDGEVVRRNRHINLGVAVALADGLVVPVVQAAEQLTLRELSRRTRELADKARAGKATPDDLRGGTFTISNLGMLDVESFGAIINPGEGAILAVASVRPQPVVREDRIEVRQMMKVTLSCDHRLVDGMLGTKFLSALKQKLESRDLWRPLAV